MKLDRIEIFASRKKTVSLILKGVGLLGLGIVTIAIAGKQDLMPAAVVEAAGWLLLLLVLFSLAYILYRTTENSPRIILDAAGITDNTTATSPGFIPWREIESFEVKTIYSTPLLGVGLKDPERSMKPSNPFLRIFHRLNRRISHSSWMISTQALEMEFDEFTELVRTYHRTALGAD